MPRRGVAAFVFLPLLLAACDGEETNNPPPTTGSSTGTSQGGGGSGATGGTGGAGATGAAGGTGGTTTTGGSGGATLCGNGMIDPGEPCDGDALGDATCEGLGYSGGALACKACELDISGCTGAEDCADGVDNDGDTLTDCEERECQPLCADACQGPVTLVEPDDTSGSTIGHANLLKASCVTESAGEVVYSVTASTTGMLDVTLIEDGSASFGLSVRTDCAADASELACSATYASSLDLSKKLSVPITAGQTVLVVVDTEGMGAEGTYTLTAQSRPIECGDGLHDPPESCDDGNLTPGDGCTAACALEGTEPEPNDTIATAAPFAAPYYAAIDPMGDVDLVKIDLAAASGLILTVDGLGDAACTDGSMDSVLTLLDAAGDPLAMNDDAAAGTLCSKVAIANLPAGSYYARIEAASPVGPSAATFPYELGVTTYQCGDAMISAGEECDGDVTMGLPAQQYDCTPTCTFASNETEPNGTLASADVYTPPSKWIARIDPDNDVDVFTFDVPGPASTISATTYSPDGALCWPGADTYLEILSPNGTVLTSNDDSVSYCSFATASNLPAGKYAVRVKATPILDMTTVYVFPYALEITVE